jgi:hypothetical protein
MTSILDMYRYWGARFWRAWGSPGQPASEVEEWVVFVMAKTRDEAIDEAWKMAERHDRVFDDGTAVSTTLFDGPVDSYNVDATEFLEDDDFGPDEIHWDTFALDGKGIAATEPDLTVSVVEDIAGDLLPPEPTMATPRFFTVKVWKTWTRFGEAPHMLEASILLLSADSSYDAAQKAAGWLLHEEEGEFGEHVDDFDRVSQIRFHSIGHVYDTGTDFLFDLLDGSRPMYSERFAVGTWGPPPELISPLSSQPAR